MSDVFSLDYSGLKGLPSSGENIRTQAANVKAAAKGIRSDVDDAKRKWNGMGSLYEGPGEARLKHGFHQPSTDADQLVDSTTTIKSAADTLADAIDDLNRRKDTLETETVPQMEGLYNDAKNDTDSDWAQSLLKSTYQGILQQQINTLATDWQQAQQDFNDSLGGIGRVSTDTLAHFDYGSNSYQVNQTERLYKAATKPGATTDDIEAYYAHIATLTEDEMAAFAATNPEARTTPPATPSYVPTSGFPTGEHGAEWWKGLSPDQKNALIAALPALVGNTNGVPYSQRGKANQNTLDLVRNDPAFTDDQRKAFESIADSLTPEQDLNGNDVPRSLLHFIPVDPGSDRPLASVAVGNVDTADNVTVTVSGMGSGTHNMDGEVKNGQTLYNGLDGERAVVTWIGYDSPDKPDKDVLTGIRSLDDLEAAFDTEGQVLRSDHADVGGTQLAHFLDGMHETRDAYGDVPTTNVAAHSYGTTAAAEALVETKHDVDRFIMFGSAGIDPAVADHASDFNVKEGPNGQPQVYATIAYDDPWAPAGQIPSERLSPTAEEFGAQVFSSDGGPHGEAGTGHGQVEPGADNYGYLETGSQSLNTIDKIISGQADDVDFIDESRYDSDPKAQWVALEEVVEFKNDPEGYVEDKKDEAIEWVGDKKDDAVDWVNEKKDDAVSWGEERIDDAEEFIDDRREDVEDGLRWGDEKKDEGIEWAEDRRDDAVQWGNDRREDAEEFIDDRREDIEDGLEYLGDKKDDAIDTVEDGAEWVGDRGSDLKDGLSGLKDKIL